MLGAVMAFGMNVNAAGKNGFNTFPDGYKGSLMPKTCTVTDNSTLRHQQLTYTYDAKGNIARTDMIDEDGTASAEIYSNDYSGSGQAMTSTEFLGNGYLYEMKPYDSLGRLSKDETHLNPTLMNVTSYSYQYFPDGAVKSSYARSERGGICLIMENRTYAENGLLQTRYVEEYSDGAPINSYGPYSYTYSYDAASRVTLQVRSDERGVADDQFAYVYDAAGNVIQVTESGESEDIPGEIWTITKTYGY